MNSRSRLIATLALLAPLLGGCPSPTIYPLSGEDPEIAALLGPSAAAPQDASALGAARRLHQALVQGDTDTAWALLAAGTRQALDQAGQAVGATGRELLDEGALPTPARTLRRVNFATLFFGDALYDLRLASSPPATDTRQPLSADTADGRATPVVMVRESDGWKLLFTTL